MTGKTTYTIPGELLGNELPDRLVKFASINDFALSMLKDKKIYVPSAGELNDPMESLIYEEIEPPIIDYDNPKNNHIRQTNNQTGEEKISILETEIKKWGVFSASTFDFDNTHQFTEYSRAFFEQWSYYGDQHNGIAIVFEPKKVDRTRLNAIPWIKVKYCYQEHHHRYKGKEFKCPNIFPSLPEDVHDIQQRNDYLFRRLSCKHCDWEHEQEWRLIFPYLSGVRKNFMQFFDLKGLHFGYRVSNKVITNVLDNFLDLSTQRNVNSGKIYISRISTLHPQRSAMEINEFSKEDLEKFSKPAELPFKIEF